MSPSCERKPDDVDAFVGDAEPGEQEPDRERVGAGDDEARARPAADLRPGAEQHLQPLARLVAAGEDDRVLTLGRDPPRRGSARRSARPPRAPPSQRSAEARACSETAILWSTRSMRKPQTVHAEPHPAELARRVVGRHDRLPRDGEDGDADRRRHRLVQVQDVESLALEHAPDPEGSSGG